jgi:hypothetical protein
VASAKRASFNFIVAGEDRGVAPIATPSASEKTCDGRFMPRCCLEEQKGRLRMTTAATLLTLITHAQQHVAALESLVAGMAAGLHAGMVDADHLYTLMATQTRAINAQLDRVATVLAQLSVNGVSATIDGK